MATPPSVADRVTLSPAVSVIVPVHNSELTLAALVARLTSVLDARPGGHEILLVNDGSRDRSWEIAQDLARHDSRVRGVDLVRNSGQHNATLCGVRIARGHAIVTIDDDQQNRPEDIPRLLDRLDDGYDVVYGTPSRPQWGLVRNAASRIMKLAMRNVMSAETAEMVGGFRAFRTDVREAFSAYRARYANIDVLLTWGASRFAAVPVEHEARQAGRSGYSYYRLFVHTWNMVTGFSTLPLQVATAVGFFFTLFGIAIFAFALLFWVFFDAVQGFTFFASIIAIFAGAQLFAIGIIGEYLGRMFQRTSGEPAYIVRRFTDE